MKFIIEIWDIENLINLFNEKEINLNPSFQRKEIWPLSSKQSLIESIKNNFPIPNIFLYRKSEKGYDVVDGQQRIRAIVGFQKKLFKDDNKCFYTIESYSNYLKYKLAVIIITELSKGETLEYFYTLVNNTGLKLNRPELKKAEYFDTRFLSLLENAADIEKFKNLQIFSSSSLNRMNDIDYVGELISQIKYKITDKKLYVDKMFDEDITKEEYDELFSKFNSVINKISIFNDIYSIKLTRYRQKNDFYTLFGFINENIENNQNTLNYFYKTLVLIEGGIYPTNDNCEAFKDYARNCVTQSNSKFAREERLKLFNELFLNDSSEFNETQQNVLNFFGILNYKKETINGFTLISAKELQNVVKEPVLL